MKQLIAIFLLAFFISCNSPVTEKEYKFPEVSWTIKVSSDFEVMDSAAIAKLNSKGQKALEKTYDTTLNFSETKTLISFKKGQFNTFTSTITPFDTAKDGNWNEINQGIKDITFETFRSQLPDIKIDTSSSIEKIDNILFDKSYTKVVYPNGMILHSYLYSQLRKGYDFGITITYTDEKIGERLKQILTTSKFE